MKKLPEKYYIKCVNDPLWEKYMTWLNMKYGDVKWVTNYKKSFEGDPAGFDGKLYFYKKMNYVSDASFTEITLKQWNKIINNKTKNKDLMSENKIKMSKMLKVIEGIYDNKEIRDNSIPIFMGNPGLGKTVIIREFAEKKGVTLMHFIASQRLPNELSGISMPDVSKEVMKFFDYDSFLKLKDGDIVFFDELLNANPMVLSAMLTMLEDRCMVSGKKLPDLMFIAAANWQGATMVTPQIKERFIYYDVEFDRKLWGNFMYKKYNIIDPILDDLFVMIEAEGFKNSDVNYNTPRSFDKAINMILHNIYTPYENRLKPILKKLIENTSENSVQIGEYLWLPKEKLPWLTLRQKQLNIK